MAVRHVFLRTWRSWKVEIGLAPNTDPVRTLIELDANRDVTVHRDRSTTVLGFFAAGDVTDERERQILIAASAGARAVLALDRYLSRSPVR